jgi:hypothetical protein
MPRKKAKGPPERIEATPAPRTLNILLHASSFTPFPLDTLSANRNT